MTAGECKEPASPGEELSRERHQKMQVPVAREPGPTTSSPSQCVPARPLCSWCRAGQMLLTGGRLGPQSAWGPVCSPPPAAPTHVIGFVQSPPLPTRPFESFLRRGAPFPLGSLEALIWHLLSLLSYMGRRPVAVYLNLLPTPSAPLFLSSGPEGLRSLSLTLPGLAQASAYRPWEARWTPGRVKA